MHAILAAALLLQTGTAARSDAPFVVRVVDDATGRGVPLVELRTVNEVKYYTDSGGIVAVTDADLMGQKVYFHVRSHGYEFPKDGFGYAGKALDVKAGGSAELRLKRLNVAQRLYRVTGGGIYNDSVMAGLASPIRAPLLNGQVYGSDSVVSAVYHGKIYWFWGDTNRPSYPLGNFQVPGATSALPVDGGVDPAKGVDLEYFVDAAGFAKKTCDMPGEGPTWISGLTVLKDSDGRERMFASYAKIKGFLTAYERGLVEWDDEAKQWRKLKTIALEGQVRPEGHPFEHEADGVKHVYFASPYPLVRVRANVDAFLDIGQYEVFTCLKRGSKLNAPEFERDSAGKLVYSWKRGADVVGPAEEAELVKKGKLSKDELRWQFRDAQQGKPAIPHGGSVHWNAFRGRFVMIFVESGGSSSFLGEVWYADAPAPEGPWENARKIVTHDKYTFYNPKHHPFFDQDGGRVIFFEGTYANTFSGNPVQTPRYDYNQVMYKLELDDPRMGLGKSAR